MTAIEDKTGWTHAAIRMMAHVMIPAPKTMVTAKMIPEKRCIRGV
jgi:hypothetical protein